MARSEAHVRIGSEVKYKVASSHRLPQRRCVSVVASDKTELPGSSGRFEELFPACREIVPPDHAFPGSEQTIDEITANKSCGAGHKDSLHRTCLLHEHPHRRTPSIRRLVPRGIGTSRSIPSIVRRTDALIGLLAESPDSATG